MEAGEPAAPGSVTALDASPEVRALSLRSVFELKPTQPELVLCLQVLRCFWDLAAVEPVSGLERSACLFLVCRVIKCKLLLCSNVRAAPQRCLFLVCRVLSCKFCCAPVCVPHRSVARPAGSVTELCHG